MKISRTPFLLIKNIAQSIYTTNSSNGNLQSPCPTKVTSFHTINAQCSDFKHRSSFQILQLLGIWKRCRKFSSKAEVNKNGYTLDQIYNFDEMGIHYKCIPWKTYLKGGKACPRIQGWEKKNHLTVMFSANVNGGLWGHTHPHLMV